MTAPALIFAFALPALCGYLFIRSVTLDRRLGDFFEEAALGTGAGLGFTAFALFLLGVAGVPFSVGAASLVLILLTVPFILLRRLFPRAHPGPGADESRELDYTGPFKGALVAVMLIWLGWRAGFVLYEGMMRPVTVSMDAWWNWASGAKAFLYSGGLMLDPSDEHFFGRGYRVFLGYPILNPLVQVWISMVLGDYHESLSKSFSSVYYLAILGVFYFTVRREGGRFAALTGTFFLSAAPLFTYHAIDGYTDLALSFYVMAGGALLWRHMESGSRGEAALAGLFFAMAAFTKNEGAVFLGAASIAFVLYNLFEKRLDARSLAAFFVPAALFILPWLVFKAWYGIGYGHGYGRGGAADEAGGMGWSDVIHFEVIWLFLKGLFLNVDHGLVFPFLGFVSIAGARTLIRSNVKYLLLIIVLMVLVLLFVYTTTHDYIYVINNAATNRNILTFTPLAFLTAALLVIKVLKGEKKGTAGR